MTLAAALAVALLPTQISAARDIRFLGQGWGHGIGMSQYGAYGLARKGWSAGRILRQYYRGSSVTRRRPPRRTFRVGLLQNRRRIAVKVLRGTARIRLRDGTVIEEIGAGTRRSITVTSDRRFRVRRPGGSRVGGRDWGGGRRNHLEVRRRSGAVVHVAQWGHSIGRGYLRFVTRRPSAGHVVAVVDDEQYLYGLGEVPSSWPMAALKAQAIAGRTYAHRTVAAGRSGCACDIRGDTRDQAYIGWDKEAGASGDRWVRAVRRTELKIAVYGGTPIATFYSSSSGGYTENIENVWTGAAPRPYLKGVCDPGDWTSANPNRKWSLSLSPRAVASRLRRPNGMVAVRRIRVRRRGVSGRVVRATVIGVRSSGTVVRWTTSGWTLRSRLGLKDTRFWVNRNRVIRGRIRRAYDRMGCRPGTARSARTRIGGGRYQRFRRGLMYWHAGRRRVTWIRGSVLRKYRSVSGHRGPLGLPWSFRKEGRGYRARFDRGDIYFKPRIGSYIVRGRFLRVYRRVGGPRGRLKFPVSDVERLRRGRKRIRFQGGRIVCRRGGGCRVRYR